MRGCILLALAAALLGIEKFSWGAPRYTLTDLGALSGGGGDSFSASMNNRGQVVGSSSAGENFHAFLWSPTAPNGTTGSMVNLGALPGFDHSQ